MTTTDPPPRLLSTHLLPLTAAPPPLLLLPAPPPPPKPKKPPLTHFLSLPLHHSPHLQPALDLLSSDIATHFPDLKIPKHAMRPAECVHLTLGVLSLPSRRKEGKDAGDEEMKTVFEHASAGARAEGEGGRAPAVEEKGEEEEEEEEEEAVQKAVRILEDLDLERMLRNAGKEDTQKQELEQKEAVTGGNDAAMEEDRENGGVPIDPVNEPMTGVEEEEALEPLRISLQGLKTMGSAKKASVLYISPVDHTSRLHRFAEAVRQHFVDAGFIVDEKRDLKLHATILNTVYARRKGRKGNGRPTQLDLRGVLEKWEERVFVEELAADRVVLCLMGAKEVDGVKGAGGYEEVAGRFITPSPSSALIMARKESELQVIK
ncbi:AKAP7 2'5' RNA ligase-like domain-containing protein [Sphaerosporella brunnea]|uniref:AKAP7 2'5' RNA ligase-like domain-containing protein n=1 Tax=Sphaerosporella brunnea TaxID=1250544 RepID=A0A5J5EVU0_9PEZI|nr:AKAP7 2'5' RNA ligase-like domain-containing protein [Sphaerosporella brunnea]